MRGNYGVPGAFTLARMQFVECSTPCGVDFLPALFLTMIIGIGKSQNEQGNCASCSDSRCKLDVRSSGCIISLNQEGRRAVILKR